MKKLITVLLIISIVFFPVSCQKKLKQDENEPEYTKREEIEQKIPDEISSLITLENYPEDIKQILGQISFRDIPKSAYNKIDEAYTIGNIDKQSHVLLTLTAAFSPSNLPDEYTGPRYEGEKKTLKNEITWLIKHQAELDEATYEAMLPFILSPKDPGSYFHPAFDIKEDVFGKIKLVIKVSAADDWTKKDVVIPGISHKKITIYYSTVGLKTEQVLAVELQVAEIEAALKHSWPKFTQLLGFSLTKDVDVFLTDELPQYTDGEAVSRYDSGDNIISYEIKLNSEIIACSLQSTTAHELFHCFQYEMGLTWYDESPELDWLTEATAVWAENYAYPDCNKEHQYLDDFFYYLSHDRFSAQGTREYGSYMLFFFLSEIVGKKSYIPEVLYAASGAKESKDVRGAIMNSIDDIKEKYGSFALCNWNYDPYRKYKDTPGFPKIPAQGESGRVVRYIPESSDKTIAGQWFRDDIVYLETVKPGVENCKETIAPGGIKYIVYLFEDTKVEDIQKIKFDFSDPEGVNDIKWMKRQAYIKIRDKWQEKAQDWTDKDEVEFCRKKDDEFVTAIVLVLSNAGLLANDSAEINFKVDTKDKCIDLAGYVKATIDASYTEGGDTISIKSTYYSKDELLYCSDCDRYVFKSRNISYDDIYSARYLNPYLAAIGTTKYENTQTKITGTLYEEYTEDEKYYRLRVSDDNKKISILFAPDTKSDDWMDVRITDSFTEQDEKYTTSEPGLLIGSVITGWLDFEVGTREYNVPMGAVYDECDIADDFIYGIRRITTLEGAQITLEFRYDIKSILISSQE